jgi:molybdopterin converting factor small subunit
MTTLKFPSPLRPYTNGLKEVEVKSATVGLIIEEITNRFPQLRPHLFDEQGDLRAYVNIFLNEVDVRALGGVKAQVGDEDRLMIVPSIAGGNSDPELVDFSALQFNQATIILLLLFAFVFDVTLVVPVVALIMLAGTVLTKPGFQWVYRIAKKMNIVKAEFLADNREPHNFAQGFGSIVLILATLAFLVHAPQVTWILSWVVIVLAGVNLFLGFCVGCALYYWLNRIGVPFFQEEAPSGRVPGVRPPKVRQV